MRNKTALSKIGNAVLATLGGGLLVFILTLVLRPTADLQILLTQPLPSPTSPDRNQILVLRNDGKKAAANVVVTVEWPRMIQPLDYMIQASRDIAEETRGDAHLRFKTDRLPPSDYIIVVMALTGGHRIRPSDIRIVHNEGVVASNTIESAGPSKWRNAR